jgi:hypothetical protein
MDPIEISCKIQEKIERKKQIKLEKKQKRKLAKKCVFYAIDEVVLYITM